MADGMHGPPGPTAGQIVNITVGVRAPVHRLLTEANIASAETLCQQIAPVECVVVRNPFLNSNPQTWTPLLHHPFVFKQIKQFFFFIGYNLIALFDYYSWRCSRRRSGYLR